MGLTVRPLPGEFAVCRFAPATATPAWAVNCAFCSITRTAEELSIICPAGIVPPEVRIERDWSLFQLVGPFPFSATGILSSVLAPLASVRISALAVATFDTDYFLIKSGDVGRAIRALQEAGHTIETNPVLDGRVLVAPMNRIFGGSGRRKPFSRSHRCPAIVPNAGARIRRDSASR